VDIVCDILRVVVSGYVVCDILRVEWICCV
jgi:hypothetical protein